MPASSYDGLPDGLKRFISCVIGMAWEQLNNVDPKFANQVEEIYRLQAVDLYHSAAPAKGLPVPNSRLNDEWHKTLESVLDLYSGIQTLKLGTDLIGIASPDEENFPIGVMVNYHLGQWWPNAQSVVEKAIVCAKYVLRRTGMPRTESRPLEESVESDLNQVFERLKKRRNPDLHGGPGNLFEEITKDGLWETMVALRAAPSVTIDGISAQAAARQDFRAEYSQRNYSALLEMIGTTFDRLADGIGCSDAPTELRTG